MNKKGLSQVVTTVLIILIVLAAVVIIWAFVRPTITEAGEQITTDCITLDLEVLSCITNSTDANSTVQVRRNAGVGELTGMRLILMETNGDTATSNEASLGELESETFIVVNANATEVSVAALIGESQRACNPQYEPFVCTIVS